MAPDRSVARPAGHVAMPQTEPTFDIPLFPPGWSPADASARPAWVQIEEQLGDRIESGALEAGKRLPPEREIAEALGVSRMTVRQAFASLAARGLVERGVGRGTFVGARTRVDHELGRVAGFTAQVERQGLEAGAEILSVVEQRAPVVRLERVRSGGGLAVTLEDSFLPAERFPGLLAHDLSGSVYALM